MDKYFIGIDLGGTKIAAVLADSKGKPILLSTIPTEASKGKKHVINRIAFIAKDICAQANVPFSKVAAVGIGAPGTVDDKTGTIQNAPNLPGWKKVPLKAILKSILKKNIFVENDANCAAVAELKLGAGKKLDSFVYVTISTGIGGGIIIGRKLFKGSQGAAGEIGHTVIDIDGEKCGCGRRGHFEAIASGPSIARKSGISTHELNELVKKGDKKAISQISEAGRIIGIGLSNIANILNPEAIIIGGGITNFGKPLFNSISKSLNEYCLDGIKVKIIPAGLKKDVGAIGALSLCL